MWVMEIIKMHNYVYYWIEMKVIAFMVAFKTIQANRGNIFLFINLLSFNIYIRVEAIQMCVTYIKL